MIMQVDWLVLLGLGALRTQRWRRRIEWGLYGFMALVVGGVILLGILS